MSMLISTAELLPHEQPHLIKRVKQIKAPKEKLIDAKTKERLINELAEKLGMTTSELAAEVAEKA